MDTSHLIDYVPPYVFPDDEHDITTNIVCGVSLGGHAAWQCLVQEPRITAAISIIGCPDYLRLMKDRARLSRLNTWDDETNVFIGSKDFPISLVKTVQKHDPAAIVMNDGGMTAGKSVSKSSIIPAIQGKRLLNMSGGADKLVPYKCSEPFLGWLKTNSEGFYLEDIVFDGVAHAMSPDMAKEVDRFVIETLDKTSDPVSSPTSSKM